MLRSAAKRLFRQRLQGPRSINGQQRLAETQAVAKQLDWDELSDIVTSDEGKRELAALRSSFYELQNRLKPGKAVSINWDQYKGNVEPETLELFRKTFSELKFPDYDSSKDIEAARAAFKPLYEQAEELSAYSEKRLKEIDAELKALRSEKENMTKLRIDEELANHPEIAKKIDKEISEGDFTA